MRYPRPYKFSKDWSFGYFHSPDWVGMMKLALDLTRPKLLSGSIIFIEVITSHVKKWILSPLACYSTH